MTESILLIDLSAIYWACWFSSANDTVSAAKQRTLAQIAKLVEGQRHVAICCDSGKSFRKDIFAEYKANRPEKDKSAVDELRQVRERLIRDGFVLWEESGMEADDIIASACREATKREINVTIATADKDLFALISPFVSVLSTRSGNSYDPLGVFEKFGVPPEKMRDLLALTGDTSDNIPGVPRIGVKTAAQLLADYDSIEGILLAASNELQPMTPSVRAALTNKDNLTALRISRELVTLNTSAKIDFDSIFTPRETKPLPTRDYSAAADVAEAALDDMADEVAQSSEPIPEGTAAHAILANAEETGQKPGALIVRPVSYEQELQPRNVNQAWTLAKGIYQSRLYSKFPNPESIWAIIIRGREMGLGALTALDNFHVIEGKPSPYAYLIIARAKAHPDCEYFQCVETTAKSATWETKNRNNPKPTKLTYTYEQAEASKLPKMGAKGPNGWLKNPEDMVRKACGVKLARMEYPDAALGLYSVEEMTGEEE